MPEGLLNRKLMAQTQSLVPDTNTFTARSAFQSFQILRSSSMRMYLRFFTP